MVITRKLTTATHDSRQEIAEGRIVVKQSTKVVRKVLAVSILLAGLLLVACKNPTTPGTISPPVTCSPASGSTTSDTTPLLNWEDVSGATGYHVQANTNDSFMGPMVEESRTFTTSQYQDLNAPRDSFTMKEQRRQFVDDLKLYVSAKEGAAI